MYYSNGKRDRYFAKYMDSTWDLVLGDNYYSLSRLTEQYLDGRGGRGGFRQGNWGMEAHYAHTRWSDPEEKNTAFRMDYTFLNKHLIGADFFKKK